MNRVIALRHVALVGALLCFLSRVSQADLLTINATVDATIEDTHGSGTFNSINATSNVNLIRNFAGLVIDRAVVEYSLGSLPTNAIITDVTFNFGTQAVTGSSTKIDILGFSGNGTIALADATKSATLLASYNAWTLGTGSHSVNLGAAGVSLLSSLVGSSNYFALRFQGNPTSNTQFYSIEGAALVHQQAPQLSVTYAIVPEPGSISLLGMGAVSLLAFKRRNGSRARFNGEES